MQTQNHTAADDLSQEAAGEASMGWNKILAQSVWILAVALLVYGSGWQYCMGLVHALGAKIYFVVPWDAGLGNGFTGLATISVLAGLGYFFGYLARIIIRSNKAPRWWPNKVPRRWAHIIGLVLICLLVLFMPRIIWAMRVPSVAEEVAHGGQWRFWALLAITLVLSYYLAFINLRKPRSTRDYVLYAVAVLALVSTTFYFSTLLGRAAAHNLGNKATITFTDPDLQRTYGSALYSPIMEKADDVIVARCTMGTTTCKLMVIHKSLIRVISFEGRTGEH